MAGFPAATRTSNPVRKIKAFDRQDILGLSRVFIGLFPDELVPFEGPERIWN